MRLTPFLLSGITCAATSVGQTTLDIAHHVANRVGFGWHPSLATQLDTPTKVDLWITSQLNPTNPQLDNATVQTLLGAAVPAGLGLDGNNEFMPAGGQQSGINQMPLILSAIVRATYADWQLNERMTWFWNNHFNRSWTKLKFFFPGAPNDYPTWFMFEDDRAYRTGALGTFRNLLGRTAESVAMLIYLDNYLNQAAKPNENWGRELLELFSMGPVNESTGQANYTQADVIAAAKCFTDWTVVLNGSNYTAAIGLGGTHDTTQKVLFAGTPHAVTIPANGTAQVDGNLLLDALANADATKDFMVRKLMRFFLGETAATDYPALLVQAKAKWGLDGNIKQVLDVLLRSSPMVTAQGQWNKVKTPLDSCVSLARLTAAQPYFAGSQDVNTLLATAGRVEAQGQPLYRIESPDGFPDYNTALVSVSGYFDWISFATLISLPSAESLYYPIGEIVLNSVPTADHTNPTAIAQFLWRHWFADKALSSADLAIVVGKLSPLPPPTQSFITWATSVHRAAESVQTFTHAALR